MALNRRARRPRHSFVVPLLREVLKLSFYPEALTRSLVLRAIFRPRIHPVSIARFPLSRFSPGAGLLRNPFVHRWWLRFSRGWVRKDGNLVTETGCMKPWSASSGLGFHWLDVGDAQTLCGLTNKQTSGSQAAGQ